MQARQADGNWQPNFRVFRGDLGGFNQANPDYYAVLQIDARADQEIVRAAYRSLVRRYHPDQNSLSSAARIREINAAYEILGDPVRRRIYDHSRIGRLVDLTDGALKGRSCGFAGESFEDYYATRSEASSESVDQRLEGGGTTVRWTANTRAPDLNFRESKPPADLSWISWLALAALIMIFVAIAGFALAALPAGASGFTEQTSAYLESTKILVLTFGVDIALACAVVLAWRRRSAR